MATVLALQQTDTITAIIAQMGVTYDSHLHILGSLMCFYYISLLFFWIMRLSTVTEAHGISDSPAAETAECGFTANSALDPLTGVSSWLVIMVAFELELLFVIFLVTSDALWHLSETVLIAFALLDVCVLNLI